MSYVLGDLANGTGVTTSDAFTSATTLRCPGAVRVNFEIRQAAIVYELAYRYPGQLGGGREPQWTGQLVPAGRTLRSLDRNIDGVRVKSAVAGVPAVVTIEAMLPDEISDGPLGGP